MVIAIGPSTASTMSARLISCAGLRKRKAAAGAANAGEQAAGGELAHQFLRGGKRNACLGRKLGRAEASAGRPAGGGGHQDDRIIGKVTEAHGCNSELSGPI